MKKLLIGTAAALAMTVASAVPSLANVDTRANGSTVAPVPIDNWALRDVITNIELNPSGTMMLTVMTASKDGDYFVEFRKTDNLSEVHRRINADPMEIISANWLNDDTIFGTAWQVTRKSVGGPEEDVRDYITYSYNVKDDKWSKLSTSEFSKAGGNIEIVSLLPKEEDKVLITTRPDVFGGNDLSQLLSPASYYKLDLRTGAKQLVYKGNREAPFVGFDLDGNIVYKVESKDDIQREFVKSPGSRDWNLLSETDLGKEENIHRVLMGYWGFQGMKGTDPYTALTIERGPNGDNSALYEVDLRTGERGQMIAQAPNGSDVMRVARSSNYWAGDQRVVAAVYPGEKMERVWLDEREKSLHDKIARQIPNAHQVSIRSRSRDGQKMIINNRGPRDPGSYYYLDGNSLMPLGSANPTVKPDDLSDVRFEMITARDGGKVPTYITMPKGSGPFPTVVLPHGGPHVNEVITYDEWGQVLANNGYMVIQPQYRMSTGWGVKHFESAYGEHGLAMQDDKDDAALWAVEQGLADPDRLAMFGWSYGGYAALVAAQREPNLYQCVIAGAAVAAPGKVYRMRRSPWAPKPLDQWSKDRGGTTVDPVEAIDKVNIPVMMVHGDWDSRVLYFNYKDYKKAAKKAGKDNMMKFVTLKGADHFYRTLMNEHQEDLYTEMLDFLKNDCGPGGL